MGESTTAENGQPGYDANLFKSAPGGSSASDDLKKLVDEVACWVVGIAVLFATLLVAAIVHAAMADHRRSQYAQQEQVRFEAAWPESRVRLIIDDVDAYMAFRTNVAACETPPAKYQNLQSCADVAKVSARVELERTQRSVSDGIGRTQDLLRAIEERKTP